MSTSGRSRLSLDLDQASKELLQKVTDQTHSASYTETIKRALVCLDLVSRAKSAHIIDADGQSTTLRIL